MQNNDMKQMLKQHIITILSLIAIIALALPMATVVSKTEIMGNSATSKATVSGFKALSSNFFAYFLLLGPIVLIAMNYVKQLEQHKGLLAVLVPAVCMFALILVVIQAKSGTAAAKSAAASSKVTLKIGFGAILAGISYIATAISGAVIYHNFKLDKTQLEKLNLEKLKAGGADLLNSAQQKVAQLRNNSGEQAPGSTEAPVTEQAPAPVAPAPAPRNTNVDKTEEILDLIEKLSTMKERGILSEEEFQKKKQELLEEI